MKGIPGRADLVALVSVCLLAVLEPSTMAFAAVIVAPGDFTPLPADSGSRISTLGGGVIDETRLATLLASALIKDGVSNVQDATFLFQECYGGGMLGGLANTLGNSINWVGGSASQYNQYSIGQPTPQENVKQKYPRAFESDQPMNFWTQALVPWLNQQDIEVFRALKEAAFHDPVGTNTQAPFDALLPMKVYDFFGRARTLGPEHGQATSSSGGQNITLACPNCKQHFAVLWAGLPNRLRVFNDISSIRATLISLWGDPASNPNVHIEVFYGDGVAKVSGPDVAVVPPDNHLPADWQLHEATLRSLQAYVKGVLASNIGPDSDFFFYATDHGADRSISNVSRAILPNEMFNQLVTVDEEALGGMLVEQSNIPTLSIDYAQLLTALPVFFNGQLLGDLEPTSQDSLAGTTTQVFPVPESLIGLTNEVQIGSTADHGSYFLGGLTFDTGSIGTDPAPAVPEPSTLLLLCSAIVGLGSFAFARCCLLTARPRLGKIFLTARPRRGSAGVQGGQVVRRCSPTSASVPRASVGVAIRTTPKPS